MKEFIAESREGLDRMEQCLTTLEVRHDDPELIDEIFRVVHTVKGTTGFLGFRRLEALAHAGEGLLGALRAGRLGVSSEIITLLLGLHDRIRQIVLLVEATGGEGTRSADRDDALIETLRLQANPHRGPAVAAVASAAAAAVAAAHHAPPQTPPTAAQRTNEPAASPAIEPEDSLPAGTDNLCAPAEKTVRIDVDVLNRMMNLVSELVLTRNQILQTALETACFVQLGRRLDAVTTDLRETVMQARMQPVGNLFSRFPRMVRDLAKSCERMVRIEFSGQDTCLDRSLIEAINDPLTHAVRNAVDHGIEPPVTRLKFGKPAIGVIRLRASQQAGSVLIEVSDDGAGIAVDRILAKAIEQKLTTTEKARAMTERDVLQIVFRPGFSTATRITHISGRGVGLDVVRSNVEKVGGSVELESQPGKGTVLRLRVPLTVAIIPALVVLSGGQSFALPQSALIELVYVSAEESLYAFERIGDAELYRLRESLLPVVRLDRMLGIDAVPPRENASCHLAVMESDGSKFGLLIDDLVAPEEIVVKPLSRTLREIGLFSGATVLGNGTLALILDLAVIASRAGAGFPDQRTAPEPASDPIEAETGLRFLIFDEGRDNGIAVERTAIPLESVERIESVPFQSIEYAGGEALLQYLGETLTLNDGGGVLKSLFAARQTATGSTVTVVICNHPDTEKRQKQRLGVVVRSVFQVASGSLLAPSEPQDDRRLALVDSRLTTVHERFAGSMHWPSQTSGREALGVVA